MNSEHLAATPGFVDNLKARCTYPASRPGISGAIGSVLGIPVVIDESLPSQPGWELRNVNCLPDADVLHSYIRWIDSVIGGGDDRSDS